MNEYDDNRAGNANGKGLIRYDDRARRISRRLDISLNSNRMSYDPYNRWFLIYAGNGNSDARIWCVRIGGNGDHARSGDRVTVVNKGNGKKTGNVLLGEEIKNGVFAVAFDRYDREGMSIIPSEIEGEEREDVSVRRHSDDSDRSYIDNVKRLMKDAKKSDFRNNGKNNDSSSNKNKRKPVVNKAVITRKPIPEGQTKINWY